MSSQENIPILDNMDVFSDLLASLGTHSKDRPLRPFECSTCIVKLKNETNESWEDISSRLQLGKKKTNDFSKKTDTTMVRNFANLQNISKKRAYTIDWGESSEDMVGFTSAVYISKLEEKKDQDELFDAILESYENDGNSKKIVKKDVIKIVEEKKKSPEIPIKDIIESVTKRKYQTDTWYKIGIKPTTFNLEKIKKIIQNHNKELVDIFNEKIFNEKPIHKARINEKNTLWLTVDEITFNWFERNWQKQNLSMTSYFNKILEEKL